MNKFVIQAFIFTLLLFLLQTIWVHFFPIEKPSFVSEIQNTVIKKNTIIYFGDSTLTAYGITEASRESMPQLLGDKLSNYTIFPISHDAFHPGIFADYSQFIKEIGFSPKIVIVPINLRSFGPEWDLRPGFQFYDETTYFSYIHSPFAVFIPFLKNIITIEEDGRNQRAFENAQIFDGTKALGKAVDLEKRIPNETFDHKQNALCTFFYMGTITSNHRKLLDLKKIVDVFANTHTKVIFYITPIDYQTCEKYIGKRFSIRISDNIATIQSVLGGKNVTFLNLAFSQPLTNFAWRDANYQTINEHLLFSGRNFVTTRLSQEIQNMLHL